MPRPIKWSRDVHAIRERAGRSKTETWSRQDLERLFEVGRASAQTLMKAVGEVQTVGGAHFVDRAYLLDFLDEMVAADLVEEALSRRLERATPILRPAPLRIPLPQDLRRVTLSDLPPTVEVRQGEIRITGANAEKVVEGLLIVAQVLKNDLDSLRALLDPPPNSAQIDEGLRQMLSILRSNTG